MEAIKTFVFFDLESTGLPEFEFYKTKITELSFVACATEHLRASNIQLGSDDLPRILHKLTVCLNPRKMIQPKATDISGKFILIGFQDKVLLFH